MKINIKLAVKVGKSSCKRVKMRNSICWSRKHAKGRKGMPLKFGRWKMCVSVGGFLGIKVFRFKGGNFQL